MRYLAGRVRPREGGFVRTPTRRVGAAPVPILARRDAPMFVIDALERRQMFAAPAVAGFADQQVVTGLSNPTAMEFAPDGRIFVTQQGGQLRVVKNGSLLATPFMTLTVDPVG